SELRVRPRLASNTAGSGLGPWYLARAKALSVGLSNAYFKSLGLPTLIDESPRNLSNRRVRTRTHVGVAAVGGSPPPLCPSGRKGRSNSRVGPDPRCSLKRVISLF